MKIDLGHIKDRHFREGRVATERLEPGGIGTGVWPLGTTDRGIKAAIRDAYKNMYFIKADGGGQYTIQGWSKAMGHIEMKVNFNELLIKSAYPIY